MFSLVFFTLYMISNQDWFITEYLSNPPPSLASLNDQMEKTQTKLDKLQKDHDKLKSQASSQAGQVAAAKAALGQIN